MKHLLLAVSIIYILSMGLCLYFIWAGIYELIIVLFLSGICAEHFYRMSIRN